MNDLLSRLRNSGLLSTGNNLNKIISKHKTRFEDFYQGDWEFSKSGNVFLMEEIAPYKTNHGKVTLVEDCDILTFLNLSKIPNSISSNIQDLIFLDIETSSLSFGAGSFVFLIGLCNFSKDGLHSMLLFIDSPSSEAALLRKTEAIISDFQIIGSYNGKSFDLPFLRNRFNLHRLPYSLGNKHHIDLLHFARRLWKKRLESCKLSDIEKNILEFRRNSEEIPGWLVPQIYFDYLSNRDVKSLEGVFYHNRMDVISLAALTLLIGTFLNDPGANTSQNYRDFFSLAEMYVRNGDFHKAKNSYEKGFNSKKENKLSPYIYRNHGLLLKRMLKYDLAKEKWKIAAGEGDYIACVELAKCYEHNAKDFSSALEWAEKAKIYLEKAFSKKGAPEKYEKITHRITRIKRKKNKYEK